MLANALLCPDLQNASLSYQEMMFYLDTPLLIPVLGLEGESRQSALLELIALLSRLGGKVVVFSHTRRELHGVLYGAAAYLNSPDGRGSIVYEARERGTTKSDLILLAESIDEILGEFGIEVEDTPHYVDAFQIDETVFEEVLKEEVRYFNNPKAIVYDINSVRSTYAIRGHKSATSLEKAQAVLVTSNTAFAKAAWEYGKRYESSQEVSVVISDFSLANMAWLKAPMEAPSIPKTQLLAFCYAALKPSEMLLNKFMSEIDKLERKGCITEREHQLLRGSPEIYSKLMHYTLGEDDALNEEIIMHTLDSAIAAIKKEESEKFKQEQEAHWKTQETLHSEQVHNEEILNKISRQCGQDARRLARIFVGIFVIILLAGSFYGLGLRSTKPVIGWALTGGAIVLFLLSVANLVFGSTLKDYHKRVENWCYTWLRERREKAIGVDLSAFDGN